VEHLVALRAGLAAAPARHQATIQQVAPDVVALQEVWADTRTSHAHELAADLGMHAVFGAPSYPAAPRDDPDHAGTDLGIALLSRWPVLRPPHARHARTAPRLGPGRAGRPGRPSGRSTARRRSVLGVRGPYTDDGIAQGAFAAELATDPRLDGPCPVLLMGDLNAAVGSRVLRPVEDVLTDAWSAGGGAEDAVTLPSTTPRRPWLQGLS